ncbi:hypothetical protein pdam_00024716 [Pocillopora damicornis]|uniref:Uncharacterized protein n=1 Tax=Pocillopora damicornis TaxID=46731 RepID=A0A3M6TLR2_POCDA|nr:hypothetical protein pdam_00024716 [Pocillopora damicornis]
MTPEKLTPTTTPTTTPTNHQPADPGAAVCAAITATVKTIIEEVLLDQMTAGPNDRWTLTDRPCSSLPRPEYIARAANRKRQQLRPKDPLNLYFELEESYHCMKCRI